MEGESPTLKITKITWKQEKLWSFDEVRNVLIEKKYSEGMGKVSGRYNVKANQQEQQSCLWPNYLMKGDVVLVKVD